MSETQETGVTTAVLFAFEMALFTVIFAADAGGYVPVSKTPFLFLVAWASLRLRGLRWADVGLRLPRPAGKFLLLGVTAGVAFWAFEYFVENPVMHRLTGRYPDLTTFREVTGNLKLLGLLIALNLILAAFGEELVWRGYALSRVAALIGNGKQAWLLAILAVNTAFGLAHLYQGTAGVVQAAFQGMLLGLLYVYTGRNLIAPITAHFVANDLDFLLIFTGDHVGLTP